MTRTTLNAVLAAALIAVTALTFAPPAEAGRGHGHGGSAVGAGLIGFGVGAIVGSALTPREVYVAPPPPPAYPAYYGPVAYGPPAWTPEWYAYCGQRYQSFDPRTGYFMGYNGVAYFCR